MAETLTMEPNVERTSIENLSEDEQNSLEVGEQMQEAQDNLLAGKYKNAEELEKGYLELQQKLSNQEEEPAEEEEQGEEGEAEGTILDQLWDEATSESGEYSQETLDELNCKNKDDLLLKIQNEDIDPFDYSEEEHWDSYDSEVKQIYWQDAKHVG